MSLRSALLAGTLALAACGSGSEPDGAPPPDPCAPADVACATVTSCDHAHPFTCGYGRGEAGGYGCAPWVAHAGTDCPLQYELCRAVDGSYLLCQRH